MSCEGHFESSGPWRPNLMALPWPAPPNLKAPDLSISLILLPKLKLLTPSFHLLVISLLPLPRNPPMLS